MEIFSIFIFLSYIFCLSLITFPLCFKLFPSFPDKGYAFSKIFSVLLIGYFYFLALLLRLASNRILSSILILLLLAVISAVFTKKNYQEIKFFIKTNIGLLLLIETLFLLSFIILAILKSSNPDIYASEKFPDFNIFNRLVIEKNFPPADTWFAPYHINYYYMGHLVFAGLTRIMPLKTEIAVNLNVVFILSSIFISSFMLGFYFTGKKLFGFLSGICVCFLGNLYGAKQIIGSGIESFNWWTGSRVIKGTINEFPFFSFSLGDFHAHYIALPFVFLILGLIVSLSQKPPLTRLKKDKDSLTLLAVTALALGAILTSNPWYFPIIIFVIFISLSVTPGSTWGILLKKSLDSFILCGVLIVLSVLLFLPFLLNYSAPFKGTGVVPIEHSTAPFEFLNMFGFPAGILTFYIFYKVLKLDKAKLLITVSISLLFSFIFAFLRPSITGSLLVFILFMQIFLLFNHNSIKIPDILATVCILILLGCEIIFIRDNYGYELIRMNTVFKFHFISFSILMLLTPVFFNELIKKLQKKLIRVAAFIFSLLILFSSIYPLLTLYQKNMRTLLYPKTLTLNGMRYIKRNHPDEFDAMMWIRKNTAINNVILEATGIPYQYYSRYSTFTGRPTVLGWMNHENVWRNGFYEKLNKRDADIKKVYETINKKEIIGILKKYDVKYIIVGELEKMDFLGKSLDSFKDYFQEVYSNRKVKIYGFVE